MQSRPDQNILLSIDSPAIVFSGTKREARLVMGAVASASSASRAFRCEWELFFILVIWKLRAGSHCTEVHQCIESVNFEILIGKCFNLMNFGDG